MKQITALLLNILLLSTALMAQDKTEAIKELNLSGRVGYEYLNWDGYTSNDNTGFKGQYLYLGISGDITHSLSYKYLQRLDNIGIDSFIDAMEELNLRWTPTSWLHIMGGKISMALGSHELKADKMDLYYNSEMWYKLEDSQFGASVDFDLGTHDNLMLQITQSPITYGFNSNMYAAGLMWSGQHGFYSPKWSVNMMQYKDGLHKDKQLMNYIMLANRFDILPCLYLDIDITHRMAMDNKEWLKDYTASVEISVKPTKNMRAFAKCTRDYNESNAADNIVLMGTKINTGSVGFEYETRRRAAGNIRVFAAGMYTWGENCAENAVLYDNEMAVQAGVKINLDILGALRKTILK